MSKEGIAVQQLAESAPLYKARIIADFEPEYDGEIRVTEGELVSVLKEMGEWLIGSSQDGKIGYQ